MGATYEKPREYTTINPEAWMKTQKKISKLVNFFYTPEYFGLENLEVMKDKGGFILMPKHQHSFDIPVENWMMHNTLGMKPYFIMKEELLDMFVIGNLLKEAGAGIPVSRPKNYKKMIAKYGPEKAKEWRNYFVKDINQAYKVLLEHINNGESGVIYPEVTRKKMRKGTIEKSILEKVSKMKRGDGSQIPIVPISRIYQNHTFKKGKIITTVGEPIFEYNQNTLLEHLVNEVELFTKEKPITF